MRRCYLRIAALLVLGMPLTACASPAEECRLNEEAIEVPDYKQLGFSVLKRDSLKFKLENSKGDIVRVQFYACEHIGFDAEIETKANIKTAKNLINKLQILGLVAGLSERAQGQLIDKLINSKTINVFLNYDKDEVVEFVLLDGVQKYQFYANAEGKTAKMGLYQSD